MKNLKILKMKKNKIIYVDLDGVLCNFAKAYLNDLEKCPTQKYPQSQFGFFIKLEEIPGAIKAFKKLEEYFEVRILTRPSIYNLNSYTEKAYWVLEHLGFETLERLDMSCDKSLHIGDYLIDDTDMHGQLDFKGEFIKFGSKEFPNWEYIVNYIFLKEFHILPI
jgi:5'(3')-deoxyribonucleotidase